MALKQVENIFINYKCEICKGSKVRYWKKYSRWIEKHFLKYHKGQRIKLSRRYKVIRRVK